MLLQSTGAFIFFRVLSYNTDVSTDDAFMTWAPYQEAEMMLVELQARGFSSQ